MRTFFVSVMCVATVGISGCGTFGPTPSNLGMPSPAGKDESRCSTGWIAHPRPIACRVNRAPSLMKPSSGPLLYIADIGSETVDVFTYPAGKPVGKLKGFQEPNGLCSDAKGNVFVTDTDADSIREYPHGGTKPIATLNEKDAGGLPVGCAVDPASGDLAVTNYTNLYPQGYVEIFKHASGTPSVINALYRTFYCTYDGSGNLFIDGFNNAGAASLGEIPQGSSTFTAIGLTGSVGWPGGISWDGSQLVVGDQFANKFVRSRATNMLYDVAITNGQANVTKSITLGGGKDIVQSWLQGKTVIGPDATNEDAAFFKYPKGGDATKSITGFYEPVGATVSK